MKVILKCPACHNETIVKLKNRASSKNIMEELTDFHYCVNCEKAGLGKIDLNVIKFDWENVLKTYRKQDK